MNPKRISSSAGIIIFTFALCVDIGQAILEWVTVGISDIWDIFLIDPLVLGILWMYFYFVCKVNFTRTRAFVFFGLALLEFIPIVKQFPLWSADVIAVIIMTNMQDKFGGSGALLNNPQKLKMASRVIMRGTRGVMNKVPRGVSRGQERQRQNFEKEYENSATKRMSNRESIISAQQANKSTNETS